MLAAKMTVDYSTFQKKMGVVGTRVIPYAKVAFKKLAGWAFLTLKAHTPPTRQGRTKIKELWKMRMSRRGTVESYIIKNTYPNQNVILWMEEGTPPHEIRPKKPGGVLHWIDDDTGQDMFAKLVRHPGTPAYRMVAQTEKEVNIKIDYYIQQTFTQLDRLVGVGV